MSFLLRLRLPNVPGSLGRLATAIGAAGGDIDAIQIVEALPDGSAIDDVLLNMVPGAMPDSVVSACDALDGVKVLWISRYGVGGNLSLDLEAIESITQHPQEAIAQLVAILPLTFRADWAAVISQPGGEGAAGAAAESESADRESAGGGSADGGSAHGGSVETADAVVETGEAGAGALIVERTESAPESLPWPEEGADWLETGDDQTLAVCCALDAGRMVVLGRRGGPEFLASELARLRHLVALTASIERR